MSVESGSIIYERRSSLARSEETDGDGDGDILYMRSRRGIDFERPRLRSCDAEAGLGVAENFSSRSSRRASGSGSSNASSKELPGEGEDGKVQMQMDAEPLRRYAHSFFSKEISACRTAYLKLVVRATILTILLTWACLPIYWGSLSDAADLTGNLNAWVINRDQGRIGDSLEAAVLSAPTSGPGALKWRTINATHFPDEESVMQAVVDERTWLAIVVNTNATSKLSAARSAGDDAYDPSSAITLYYAQARNEVATGTYLLPIATAFLSNFTTNYSTGSAQRYIAAVVASDGSVNLTALNSIAQTPQTISPGVTYSIVNLRPYSTSVAQAPLLVGQIYLCIFAFILVMAHTAARGVIAQYLIMSSYLLLRIITPLLIYLPLSLSYALVSLAFDLPFGTRFSYGRGFMTFFGIVYLGMAALGLALEAMVTLLGPKFVPFFLVILIIVNVSTVALPPELQSRLYAYGKGFEFWNIQQATRTILFDTYSQLPKNAGILIAWVLISCCTTALFTWLVRMREIRSLHREQCANGEYDTVYGSSAKGKARRIENQCKEYDEKRTGKGKGSALGRWQKMNLNMSSGLARVGRYRSDKEVDREIQKAGPASTYVEGVPSKS